MPAARTLLALSLGLEIEQLLPLLALQEAALHVALHGQEHPEGDREGEQVAAELTVLLAGFHLNNPLRLRGWRAEEPPGPRSGHGQPPPRPVRPAGSSGCLGPGGKDGASHAITIKPDPCEDLFFVSKFNANNTDATGKPDLVSIHEDALSDIKAAVAKLKACGAKVTLDGLLSLLYFEGNLKAAFNNTGAPRTATTRCPLAAMPTRWSWGSWSDPRSGCRSCPRRPRRCRRR